MYDDERVSCDSVDDNLNSIGHGDHESNEKDGDD